MKNEAIVCGVIEEALEGTRRGFQDTDPDSITREDAAAAGVLGLTLSLATWALACDDELRDFINGEDLVPELSGKITELISAFLRDR